MAKDDPGAVTPAAAVARHLEWLEFALEAARDSAKGKGKTGFRFTLQAPSVMASSETASARWGFVVCMRSL